MSNGQPNVSRMSRLKWLRHVLESRGASTLALFLMVAFGFLGWTQALPNQAIVIGITLIVIFEFQRRLDQGVPLLQLTCLIAVLQWLVGPAINYASTYSYGRYSMYVPEERYFRFAIPATAFFVAIMLGTGSSIRQENLLSAMDRRKFVSVGVALNIVGIAATVLSVRWGATGGSLAFLLYLLSQLRYVGALYFICSNHELRLVFAAASCVQLVTMSLGAGVFHDLVLWLAILFCYWFAQRKWSAVTKFALLGVACAALFSIQVVKQEYRERIQRREQVSIFGLIGDYLTPGGSAWQNDTLRLAVTRLNQGWIISAVLKNVPEEEPFAEGETIQVAIVSALVPRLLWADKKKAGGRENFQRFTGLEIGRQTSMAISPLGEAYANFDEIGGIIFMVVFGAAFALFYHGTLKYAARYPTFIFWIPLIFYHAIKAETEMVVVINQLTKGAVVAFSFHYLIRRVFRLKMQRPGSATLVSGRKPNHSPNLLNSEPEALNR